MRSESLIPVSQRRLYHAVLLPHCRVIFHCSPSRSRRTLSQPGLSSDAPCTPPTNILSSPRRRGLQHRLVPGARRDWLNHLGPAAYRLIPHLHRLRPRSILCGLCRSTRCIRKQARDLIWHVRTTLFCPRRVSDQVVDHASVKIATQPS